MYHFCVWAKNFIFSNRSRGGGTLFSPKSAPHYLEVWIQHCISLKVKWMSKNALFVFFFNSLLQVLFPIIYRHSAVAQMVILLSAILFLWNISLSYLFILLQILMVFFVLFQFFETVVRYDRFFSSQSQHIPTVLVRFVLLLQK